ncbi:protein spaetzle 3 [Diorhabda sublineata]|uniref:protein spaetzle 3 n=1 Tax=Diorhabda sublineata TaxID=1163346 RepID=UPI0024E13616|nr:protein spaetzle 3 [Diorhabda sublineata]
MSLVNYSTPFQVTPNPPATNYYQSFQQYQQPPQGYSYPQPQKPFLEEEFPTNPFRQSTRPKGASNQIPQVPNNPLPNRPPTYTKVGDFNTKTSIHPIIDYDYVEEEPIHVPVTPIQGPIFIKNGRVPVVPLYSHPVLHNGTFVQIPILWTALSVVLGLELRGEYIRGVPCIKRNQQLYCPTAGNSYPLDRIELFIDENKALMKRMYGEFDMPDYEGKSNPGYKKKRSTKSGESDFHLDPGPDPVKEDENLSSKSRTPRQNFRNNQSSESGRIDSCESKIEIVTPYWASNSAGKIRAIVNTQHFEQAIHQEVCARSTTKRCSNDCGCEQKYKWHRLLAYDPDNDCKGIFMDWFLFPSCCVCRCTP